jgi:hypothetical protein
MFSFLSKNRIQINEKFRDYCIQSTNESIRKLCEKYNEERKIKGQIDCFMCNDNSSLPNNNNSLIIPVLCFLSSLYYFIIVKCKYVFFY